MLQFYPKSRFNLPLKTTQFTPNSGYLGVRGVEGQMFWTLKTKCCISTQKLPWTYFKFCGKEGMWAGHLTCVMGYSNGSFIMEVFCPPLITESIDCGINLDEFHHLWSLNYLFSPLFLHFTPTLIFISKGHHPNGDPFF